MADGRAAEAVRAARRLLEEEGEAALSMRRLAQSMGIRAPSLYKHIPDKAALEVALVAEGLDEIGAALAAAAPTVEAMAAAYRGWALAHPDLYLLVTERPLPRERLPAGLEQRAAAPLLLVAGDEHVARALWASAHGLVVLELHRRFPPDADLGAAWRALVSAFGRADEDAP